MKRIIRRMLNLLGYDMHRVTLSKDDRKLYSSLHAEDSIRNKRFYNIGAGQFSHPCWTNVDYFSDWYSANTLNTLKGIEYDLFSLLPLPIESDSTEIVYSSHTVEHINDEAAEHLFRESFRILKRGGVFRLTMPDIDLAYRAYKDGDRDYFYWIDEWRKKGTYTALKLNKPLNQASIGQIFLAHFATSLSTFHSDGAEVRIDDDELNRIFCEMNYELALNYCTSKCPPDIQRKYLGNHINWWNKEKVLRMLRKTGFEKIYLSGYGQSYSPVLRNTNYFDNTHPKVSLYVEAAK